MNSGPVISSSVGCLIACTCPHKCPLLSPRSRNHLPPGHGSIFIGIFPCSDSFSGPICSSSASNVVCKDAFTCISCVMFRVKLSIPGIVELALMLPPVECLPCALSSHASNSSHVIQLLMICHPRAKRRIPRVLASRGARLVGGPASGRFCQRWLFQTRDKLPQSLPRSLSFSSA